MHGASHLIFWPRRRLSRRPSMASQSRFDFLDGPSADRPLLDKFVVGQIGNELVLDQAGPRPIDPLGSLSVNRPSRSEQQGTSLVMGFIVAEREGFEPSKKL